MKSFNSATSNERDLVAAGVSIPRRYCDRCHLSTPKANPRCIHCRQRLASTPAVAARIQTRAA